MRKPKHPIQEFNGVRFYRKPHGYYKSDNSAGNLYMHRHVWEFYNGPIPAGYHVHHKDHDRSNNTIDNLELLHKSEHATMHGKHRAAENPEQTAAHMDAIRPKAAEWHKSDEGRKWHVEHGKRTWENQRPEQHKCTHCGCEYDGYTARRKRGFCSAKCQSAARRASGVDNEQRSCAHCGGSFDVNKYAKTRYCCISCSAAHRRFLASGGVRPDSGG